LATVREADGRASGLPTRKGGRSMMSISSDTTAAVTARDGELGEAAHQIKYKKTRQRAEETANVAQTSFLVIIGLSCHYHFHDIWYV